MDRTIFDISLYSGAGGGLLAHKFMLGWKSVMYAEKIKYAQEILKKRIIDGYLDDSPVFDDVNNISVQYIDKFNELSKNNTVVLSGGFPCQPFSVEGNMLAMNDTRNMWPSTCSLINRIRPSFCFFENVLGILSSSHGYFGEILKSLYEIGYDCNWITLSASSVGAPHHRYRLWMLAWDTNRTYRTLNGENCPYDPPGNEIAVLSSDGIWKNVQMSLIGISDDYRESWPKNGCLRRNIAYKSRAFNENISTGLYPTPTTANQKHDTNYNRANDLGRVGLSQFVFNMYPTPMAGIDRAGIYSQRENTQTVVLSQYDSDSMRLSPWWVEWLMGWPVGWTNNTSMNKDDMDIWKSLSITSKWWDTDPAESYWHNGRAIPRALNINDIKNRSARGIALGNGQVPLVAYNSIKILTGTMGDRHETTRT